MEVPEFVDLAAALATFAAQASPKAAPLSDLAQIDSLLTNIAVITVEAPPEDLDTTVEALGLAINALAMAASLDQVQQAEEVSNELVKKIENEVASTQDKQDKIGDIMSDALSRLRVATDASHEVLDELSRIVSSRHDTLIRDIASPVTAQVNQAKGEIDEALAKALQVAGNELESGFQHTGDIIVQRVEELRRSLDRAVFAEGAALVDALKSEVDAAVQHAERMVRDRVVSLVEAELSKAVEAIGAGQAFQAALTTGPWIPALHAAKLALEQLP